MQHLHVVKLFYIYCPFETGTADILESAACLQSKAVHTQAYCSLPPVQIIKIDDLNQTAEHFQAYGHHCGLLHK